MTCAWAPDIVSLCILSVVFTMHQAYVVCTDRQHAGMMSGCPGGGVQDLWMYVGPLC